MIANTRLYGGGDNDESLKSSHFRGFFEGILSLTSLKLEVLNG